MDIPLVDIELNETQGTAFYCSLCHEYHGFFFAPDGSIEWNTNGCTVTDIQNEALNRMYEYRDQVIAESKKPITSTTGSCLN